MIEKILQNDGSALSKAKEVIVNDGVICFKSDTVYGFAVDALSDVAAENLYDLKNRDQKKPIAIFVNDLAMAEKIFEFDDFAKNFCEKYLPGKVTLVLKAKDNADLKISNKLNLESNFLGFRIIDNQFINDLIAELNFPLAVTSANISGGEALLSSDQVLEIFNEKEDDFLLINGGECSDGEVSTVVKIDGNNLEILRQGAIKIEE